MLTLTYKYRMYPDRDAEARLAEALETCRWLYNRLLEEARKAKDAGKPLSMYDCHNMIPGLKKENPSLGNVYSKVLQMVSQTLWANIRGLAQLKKNGRRIGQIRFKCVGWYKTLNYNQSGFSFDCNVLHLSRIGDIKVKMHRPLQGKVKGVVVKREGEKWYALVQADTEVHELPENDRIVGIDLGLRSFAVDTDGHTGSRTHDTSAIHSTTSRRRSVSCPGRRRAARTGRGRRRGWRNYTRRSTISGTISCTSCPGSMSKRTGLYASKPSMSRD